MKKVKYIISVLGVVILLSGCGISTNYSIKAGDTTQTTKNNFISNKEINVISREGGSGTRSAFIELFSIELKGENGTRTDKTTLEATIINKTGIMLINVSSDKYAIGYISLGSLNDTIKAVKIDGVDATAENIKNKTYKMARPFNIAINENATDITKDFIDFIFSKEGQEVVDRGYIRVNDDPQKYTGNMPEGKIVIAGSSSVTPVMEELKEAYLKINPNATIEIQMSDSTTGMRGVMEGICDIGMASRDLKDSEKEKLMATAIALDGIAVIVNKENPKDSLSSEQVRQIFTGKFVKWDEVE